MNARIFIKQKRISDWLLMVVRAIVAELSLKFLRVYPLAAENATGKGSSKEQHVPKRIAGGEEYWYNEGHGNSAEHSSEPTQESKFVWGSCK